MLCNINTQYFLNIIILLISILLSQALLSSELLEYWTFTSFLTPFSLYQVFKAAHHKCAACLGAKFYPGSGARKHMRINLAAGPGLREQHSQGQAPRPGQEWCSLRGNSQCSNQQQRVTENWQLLNTFERTPIWCPRKTKLL